MTDIKDVIQSQDGSDLFNTEKGILNMACWFTGPRIVELKARVVIFFENHLWSLVENHNDVVENHNDFVENHNDLIL